MTGKTAKTHSTFLLPTDFSDSAARTLVWAARFLIRHDDHVVLMHTIEELHADPQTPEERSLYSGAEHKLAEWSHELRRQLQGKHAVIDTKVTFGAPGAACVHVADAAKVDMVVMAVHGQTDAHSLVMGPVSQFVSTFLKRCPVVLVRDGATENDDVEGDAGVSAKSAVAHAPAGVVA